jgi:hypothetical protein
MRIDYLYVRTIPTFVKAMKVDTYDMNYTYMYTVQRTPSTNPCQCRSLWHPHKVAKVDLLFFPSGFCIVA